VLSRLNERWVPANDLQITGTGTFITALSKHRSIFNTAQNFKMSSLDNQHTKPSS
jgi:hypothetical protein